MTGWVEWKCGRHWGEKEWVEKGLNNITKEIYQDTVIVDECRMVDRLDNDM